MKIIEPSTPSGFTVFCDDLRQEDNGKLICIGIYAADMLIRQLPTLLPTFFAITVYRESPTEKCTDPVAVKLFVPGNEKPLAISDVPVNDMRSISVPEGRDVTPFVSALIPIKISPLIIQQEGLIRVRAYRGDDEIRLGTLPVKLMPLQSS